MVTQTSACVCQQIQRLQRVIYSTYFGGVSNERRYRVDPVAIYITGTQNHLFPHVNAVQSLQRLR